MDIFERFYGDGPWIEPRDQMRFLVRERHTFRQWRAARRDALRVWPHAEVYRFGNDRIEIRVPLDDLKPAQQAGLVKALQRATGGFVWVEPNYVKGEFRVCFDPPFIPVAVPIAGSMLFR